MAQILALTLSVPKGLPAGGDAERAGEDARAHRAAAKTTIPPTLASPEDPFTVDASTRISATSISAKISVKADGSRRLPRVSSRR